MLYDTPLHAYGLRLLVFSYLIFPSAQTIVHETRQPNPLWKRSTDLSSSLTGSKHLLRLPLKFGLRQRNTHLLHDELLRVSDPSSDSYGKFWSPDEVAEFFAPALESQQAVVNWLLDHPTAIDPGRIRVDSRGGWIEVDSTVEEAEQLLDATYHVYTNDKGHLHVGCEFYSVPESLTPHLDLVTPTVHSPPNSREGFGKSAASKNKNAIPERRPNSNTRLSRRDDAENLAKCSRFITPVCLSHMYNFQDYRSVATDKNSIAMMSFSEKTPNFLGLAELFQHTNPDLVNELPRVRIFERAKKHGFIKDSVTPVNAWQDLLDQGGSLPEIAALDHDAVETELTVEYSIPFVHPLKVDIYQAREHSDEAVSSFDPILDALTCGHGTSQPNPRSRSRVQSTSCSYVRPASVIAISYGMSEITNPKSNLIRQCNEYGKLGLMGTTVLAGSGDYGVAGAGGKCSDGSRNGMGKGGQKFLPDFPASCPYVTAVGGTMIQAGKTYRDPEVALYYMDMTNPSHPLISSGGGFSDVFTMPQYQRATIRAYLARHPPPYSSAQYNNSTNSRAYPDLSANAFHFIVGTKLNRNSQTAFIPISGTSCSTPVVASIITLINDARLARGKKTLGFINPAIYSPAFRSAFNDITVGTNPGCGTAGFSAVPGWDPLTGLGTPDFQKLVKLWTA